MARADSAPGVPQTGKKDSLLPLLPPGLTGGLTPGESTAFTNQLAGYRLSYESTLAALKGQRKNIKSQFRTTKASIKQETVGNIVRAEGAAVERGVLGGSADVKNRVAVQAEGAAMLEAARLEKEQSLADIDQQSIQATNDYMLAVAAVDSTKQAAIAESMVESYANDMFDPEGWAGATERLNMSQVVANGDFGSVVTQIARTQLGVPYVFGAKDAGDAFDCSGFTSWVYQQATGKVLPHSAREQQRLTYPIQRRSDLQPGDLVFFWFDNNRGIPPGEASHVGIYVGGGMMIDASSSQDAVIVRPVFWDAFIGGGQIPGGWGLKPKWSKDSLL